jgi:hypothetical protein
MTTTIGADLNQCMYTESAPFDIREKFHSEVEKKLNTVGYVPIVSIISGSARFLFGSLFLIIDVSVVVFCSIADAFNTHPNTYGFRALKHSAYIFHDLTNMSRGVIEIPPFLGNAITLIYDLSERRFAYPWELKQ